MPDSRQGMVGSVVPFRLLLLQSPPIIRRSCVCTPDPEVAYTPESPLSMALHPDSNTSVNASMRKPCELFDWLRQFVIETSLRMRVER